MWFPNCGAEKLNGEHALGALLPIARFSCSIAKQASLSLLRATPDLPRFDALVADNQCQVRAFVLSELLCELHASSSSSDGDNSGKGKLKRDLASVVSAADSALKAIAEIESKLVEIGRPLRDDPVDPVAFLRSRGAVLEESDFSSDVLFLLRTYVLTLTKRPTTPHSLQFTYPDKTSLSVVTDAGLSKTLAKSSVNRLQRALSMGCCRRIEAIITGESGAEPLPNSNANNNGGKVDDDADDDEGPIPGLRIIDAWGRVSLATYVSYDALLGRLSSMRRLVVLKSFVCQTIHSPPHGIVECVYRGDGTGRGFEQITSPRRDLLLEPAFIVEGVTVSSGTSGDVASALASVPIADVILANAAQRTGDYLPPSLTERFESHLSLATQRGFSRANPSGFFINHVHCGIGQSALEKLRVAVPCDGPLHEPAIDLLHACRYKLRSGASVSLDVDHAVEFYLLPAADIPLYVAKGVVDLGIASEADVAEQAAIDAQTLTLSTSCDSLNSLTSISSAEAGDSKTKGACERVLRLPFGAASVVAMTLASEGDEAVGAANSGLDNANSGLSIPHMCRVATPFPNAVESRFSALGVEVGNVVRIGRATQLMLQSGLADVVVDTLDSIPFAERARIKTVGPRILDTQAGLFARPGHEHDRRAQFFKLFVERRTRALGFVKVQAKISEAAVDDARAILGDAGVSATVVPLVGKKDPNGPEVLLNAIIAEKQSAQAIDSLRELGAQSVVVIRCESIHEQTSADPSAAAAQ